MEETNEMLGPHLILDLYGCNDEKLGDVGFVYRFLDEMPEILDMHKMAPPYTFFWPGSDEPDAMDHGGVTGIVLISESHISIHTWPDRGYASIDIFSCKDFKVENAIRYIVSLFEAKKCEKTFVQRGREFPRQVSKAAELVTAQRKRF